MCLHCQLSVFYAGMHVYQFGIQAQPRYWKNWWVKWMLQPHLCLVTEFDNYDHKHHVQIGDWLSKLQR